MDTRKTLGTIITIKGQPTINGEGAKQGANIYDLDEISGIDNDEISIVGKRMTILDDSGDVSCTPTKFIGKGNFSCTILSDLDLESIWDNVEWEEITEIGEEIIGEVENITATAGVRG